jgi:hypothetical protein
MASGKRENWRDKYATGFGGGREGLCKQAAQTYCAILVKFCEFIESKGGKPIMGISDIEETILPAAVLTADKFLPDIDVGPETELAIGSGLIIGQAAIVAIRSKRKTASKANGTPPASRPTDAAPPDAGPAVDEPPIVLYDLNDPKTVF